jgi:hypothetical protein
MLQFEDSTIFAKCDMIVCGRESAGSAIRSCDVEAMRRNFYAVENGRYAKKLIDTMGSSVETALDKYLEHEFVPRYGAGYGITRLLQAMVDLKLVSLEEVIHMGKENNIPTEKDNFVDFVSKNRSKFCHPPCDDREICDCWRYKF